MEVPVLKDGSGKELSRLHNVLSQHLRALKVTKYEPSGPFITSLTETKLDQATSFEWQQHSQDKPDVPDFDEFLKFLDLRVQETESFTCKSTKCAIKSQEFHVMNVANAHWTKMAKASCRKPAKSTKHDVSFLAGKVRKYRLYSYSRFKAMPCGQRAAMAINNELCINCFK